MLLSGLMPIPRAVRIVPDDVTAHYLSYPLSRDVTGPAIEFQNSPLTASQLFFKRAIDFTGAIGLLIVLFPLLVVIGLVIRLETPGPVFFRQARLGHQGRPFKIFKFRSMRVLEDDGQIQQAKKNDARVTPFGRFLRRSSLDELPQLLNVVHGSMSLVGPRPHAVAHDQLYAQTIVHYELRQHVKPGITGWAQIHGFRGETPTDELMQKRVEFDIWYAKNASIALDLEILLRTIVAVTGQKNAY